MTNQQLGENPLVSKIIKSIARTSVTLKVMCACLTYIVPDVNDINITLSDHFELDLRNCTRSTQE